jgi:conjugal transfer/entry exclusion protein
MFMSNKQEILDQIEGLMFDIENAASELQNLYREHFPEQYQTGMSYEAFALTQSSNRYNTTLETLFESAKNEEEEMAHA